MKLNEEDRFISPEPSLWKRFFLFLIVLSFIIPQTSYASFAQSTDLEAGSSQYWDTTTQVAVSGGAVTFCAWINRESNPASGELQLIFRKASADNATINFEFAIFNNAGSISLLGTARSGANITDAAAPLTTATLSVWTHVCGRFDGTATPKWAFFQDSSTALGSQTTFTNNTATIANSNVPFAIGVQRNTSPQRYFDGKISHARAYNAALTGAASDGEKCVDESVHANLAGEWMFDGTGTDTGPNGYNLTAVNSAGFVSSTDHPCYVAPAATKKVPDVIIFD